MGSYREDYGRERRPEAFDVQQGVAQGCILSPILFSVFIGERERANLVVQLARFFYIYIYISRSLRAPIPNKRNVNVILQCWMQCACAVVARHVRALHLYYSWRCAYYSWQLCLFVGFHKQPVYTSSCINLL